MPETVGTPIPITIEKIGATAVISSKGGYNTGEDPSDDNDTGWILPAFNTSNEFGLKFVSDIKTQKGKIVSDGSYKGGHSTAGFIMVGSNVIANRGADVQMDNRTIVHGQMMLPASNNKKHSSYRGELGGILATVVFTNKVCSRVHNITTGKCEIVLDNKGAIAAAFGWKRPNPRWSCYDIVSIKRYHIKNSPITWASKHIKGQDDAKKFGELDEEWSQANVLADQLAKEELCRYRPVLREVYYWQVNCGDYAVERSKEQERLNDRFGMQFLLSSNFSSIEEPPPH